MCDVLVNVTSEFTAGEKRINLDLTVDNLKNRLELVTGIPPNCQNLRVYSEAGELIPVPEHATLNEIGLSNGWRIHVLDTRPREERLDLSGDGVRKYELSADDYAKRPDSVLAWKKKNHLGRFGDSASRTTSDSFQPDVEAAADIKVGSLCDVRLKSGTMSRGTVAYVGAVPDLPSGTWVGIKLDQPDGKNNGTVLGHKLFEAPEMHGICVRPLQVTIIDSDDEEL